MICSIFMALRAIYFQAVIYGDPVYIYFPKNSFCLYLSYNFTTHLIFAILESWLVFCFLPFSHLWGSVGLDLEGKNVFEFNVDWRNDILATNERNHCNFLLYCKSFCRHYKTLMCNLFKTLLKIENQSKELFWFCSWKS